MKKYKTIIADPPWKYEGRGPASAKEHRPNSYGAAPSSEERYGAMTMEELKQLPIKNMSEDKAHLYLWVTNAFIERGWQLCKDWGFEPKTVVTWGKLRRADGKPSMKTGYYFRGATEHFIFATKGNLRLKDKAVDTKVNCAYVDTTPFSEIKNDLTEYVAKQNHNQKEHRYSAPTIAEVVCWLYDKHGIFIQPFTIGEEGKMKFYTKLIVNDTVGLK